MDIAAKHGVSRRYVHQVVDEITHGKRPKKTLKQRVTACIEGKEKQCLWELWFSEWYEALADVKIKSEAADSMRLLVHTMRDHKFTTAEIARLVNRDHATIRHYLK